MASFVLKIAEIEDTVMGLSREFTLDAAWLVSALADTDLDVEADFSSKLKVRARRLLEDIMVEGEFTVEILVPCARCNEPSLVSMDGTFTQLFSNRAQELPPELELTPEDLVRETFSGAALPLDSFVREFILLEVPMGTVCEEGCTNAEVNRILGLDATGKPLKEAKKPGPLAALGDLAAQLRAESGSKNNGDT